GQVVTITAAVTVVAPAGGTLTGTVAFYVDGSSVGSAWVDGSGSASIDVSGLSVGAHAITAAYAGDGNFNPSSGSAGQVGTAGATVPTAPSGPNPWAYGQAVTITATVTVVAPASGTPAGWVTFYADGAPLGSAALDGAGHASFTVSSLAPGTHMIGAAYAGD